MVRLLIVEDSLTDAELAVRELELAGYQVDWQRVETAPEMDRALKKFSWDVVLSDFSLPKFGARPALELLRKICPEVPFIIVSGAVGEESVVDAMKAGADDFVMKSRLARLPSVIARSLREREINRREQEATQLASEAVLAREHVLAIVSHDMKNPLSAIELNLQLIQRTLVDGTAKDRIPQIRSYLERAQRSTRRMKRLVADILDQAKIESGRLVIDPEPTRAEDLISEVIEMFQPLALEKSITLESKFNDLSYPAEFDHERIFQVLTNLVGNAIKFSTTNQRVTIEVDGTDAELKFCVQDSGPGVPPEHLDRIFDRYWQLSQETKQGSGLGLSIARGIVEAHGGRIRAENRSLGGCAVGFTIPRWNKLTMAKPFQLTDEKGGRQKILLIDDDTDLRDTLKTALHAEGYEVESVADAEAGLRVLNRGGIAPALVMVDYRLPKMSGCQFIEEMHAMRPPYNTLPVILSSADDDIERKSRAVLPQGLLRKPASLKQIISLVQQVIH